MFRIGYIFPLRTTMDNKKVTRISGHFHQDLSLPAV